MLIAGDVYYLDVAFEELKLALEIDGRLHEDDPDQFESDRWRQNALVLEGWTVLRFTWPMVRDHPQELVNTVRAALAPEIVHTRWSRRSDFAPDFALNVTTRADRV